MVDQVARFAQLLAANDLDAARTLAGSWAGAPGVVAMAAIDAQPAHPARARIQVATLFMMAGDRERGIATARSAVELDSGPVLRSALGSLLVAAGQFEEAVSLLKGVVAETPGDHNAHINLATASYKLEEFGDAVNGFARAFDLDPMNRSPLHNTMAMLADMGKWVGALAILDLLQKGSPPPHVAVLLDIVSIQLMQLVANTYPGVGVDADADATVKDLLVNASKREPRSQLAAARALCDIERFAEATKLVHNLGVDTRLTPAERGDLHFIEGLLADADGYASTAIERYLRSLEVDPTRVDSATNAISLMLGEGTPAALAQVPDVLAKVEPAARDASAGLLFNAALHQHRTGNLAGARETLGRVIAMPTADPDIVSFARQALTELGA